ncbi:MAG: tetratricopeptide repeat protein, partial [Alphaproteobacteria bacterium]
MTSNANADSYKMQAHAFFAQGDFAAAEIVCRSAVIAAPDDAGVHYNLGVVLAKLERFEEAITCYRKTIELNPGFAPAYTNIGFCLSAFNLIARAREAFAIARSLEPDNPIPVLNEGIAALALGDYAAGWQGFAARWRLPAYAAFKRDFAKPVWQGQDISGKTLFLYSEQGFGDTIQMARFVPLLAAQGAKIIIEAQPALTGLLRSLQGAPHVITKGEAVPDFDFYSAMMDIPGALGTTANTIPADTPYLFADPEQIEFYRNLPLRNTKKRIGLCWAGRASHENDRNRSLKFAQLAPLLARDDIEWISLQRLMPDSDAAGLATSAVLNWGQNFADFSATAAAIMALDIVIAADTAVAHLAGALGKPVWVLLPFYADWRWMIDRE